MGKILRNGVQYTNDSNTLSVELTRAEYDNLTEAEKMNDTFYYITDVDPFVPNMASYGYTPIGTVISVMGNDAPMNYLKCDGTIYNIADYPELAQYFEQQFTASNKFGGDGVTTFAVPDLQGEFLRGAGANSHAGNGNGGVVGEHQDATIYPTISPNTVATSIVARKADKTTANGVRNVDSRVGPVSKALLTATATYNATGSGENMADANTPRPTNTSVLYCIAYKNIYISPENLYSTDETIVGRWIDGKPLYQKTYTGTVTTYTDSGSRRSFTLDFTIPDNIATYVDASVMTVLHKSGLDYIFGGSAFNTDLSAIRSQSLLITASAAHIDAFTRVIDAYTSADLSVTLKYTKTTD